MYSVSIVYLQQIWENNMCSSGLRMCAYQVALFQMSKESEECSLKIFIRRLLLVLYQ